MGPFLLFHAVLVGFFAFAAIYHLILWASSRRETLLAVFSVDCVLRAAFSSVLFRIATVATTDEADAALRARIALGLLMTTTSLWVIALVSGVRPRRVLWAGTIVFLGLVLIQVFVTPLNPATLAVDDVRLPWGETIASPRSGPPGWWFLPMYAAGIAVEIFAVYCGTRVWGRDRLAGALILFAAFLTMSLHVVFVLRGLGIVDVPYFGLVPHLVWVGVIALLIARSHQRTRDELAASEERFRTLCDQASDGIFIADAAGRYLDVNAAGCAMLGYAREEIRRLSIADVIAPEEKARIAVEVARFAGGASARSEWHFRRKDGSLFEGEVNGRQLPDRRLLGVVRDVTERKRLEEALRESALRYRSVVEDQTEFIVRWLPDGTRTFVNDAYARYFEQSWDELVGTNFLPLIETEAERETVRRRLHALTPANPVMINIHRARRGDGQARWQEWVDRGTFDANGRLVEMQSVGRDIHDRITAEQQVRESEERFAKVFQSSPAAIVVTDIDDGDRFIDVNETFEKLTGYRREEAIGRTTAELRIWNDPAEWERAVRLFREQGKVSDFEFAFRRKDGEIRTGLLSSEAIQVKGRPLVVATTLDLTERKKAEEQRRLLAAQLAQAQKMEAIGRLAGGVAHDFNNLLTVITGYCELLREKSERDDEWTASLKGIDDAGARAAALTRQLLSFSRQQIVERRVVDLHAVVRDTESLLRRLLGEDMRLVTLLGREPADVLADAAQIGQVILNLAVNARDAMPTGGTLTIRTAVADVDAALADTRPGARPGRYALLAVTDTGSGMAPEVLAHIFEPFFTTKSPGKGTGIGLATVHTIIEESGGFIGVDSASGRGSTFNIYFPLVATPPAAARAEPAASKLPRGSETILLVEDEDGVRTVTRRLLQQSGYTVVEAANGQEALRICEQPGMAIDLMISDVVMPEIGGRELVERVLALRPKLKVLYLSGYTADTIVRHGVLQTDVAFLQKPYTAGALSRKVREVLDQ